MERNLEENIEETIQKKQILVTEGNLVGRKVDNFTAHQKFGTIDEFKLKIFDQILDIWHLEYSEVVKKEIENRELDCTDGVANQFLRGFDLLKEEIKEFGEKLVIESEKQAVI